MSAHHASLPPFHTANRFRQVQNAPHFPDEPSERPGKKRQNMKAKKGQAKAKTRKTRAARKAPEATESHAAIEDRIQRVMPDLHPIVERLDELICKTIPGLQYAVKWKNAYYGLPQQGWIIEMVA